MNMTNHLDSKKSTLKRMAIAMVAVSFLVLWGCRTLGIYKTVTVEDILENPREYDGEMVRITGKVRAPFSLVLIKYFEVDDDTGSIPVISNRTLPMQGSEITIEGRVDSNFSIGDFTFAVIKEEE